MESKQIEVQMGKMLSFKLQVGKVETGQTISGFTVISPFFKNFASMENIRRRCNPTVDLLKFSSNKKILSKVVILSYN